MQHDEQVRLIRRVLHLVEADRCDMIDDEVEHPVRAYTDPDRFAAEQQHIFRGLPLALGRGDWIPAPGDFFTHDASGLPLLVTRGEDGGVRVLLNVCRHRGMRLVDEQQGNRRRFVCPYHAWNYDTCGRLVRISDEEGFPRAMGQSLSLTVLPAAERHGFIWTVLDPAAGDLDARLEQHLDGPGADWDSYGLADHVTWAPERFELAINWKLAIDIFLEAYHVRYVHTRSIYPIFFDNVGLFERLGPHQRNLFPKRSIGGLTEQPESDWVLRQHSNILYHVFPNTLLLFQPDHVSTFHILPDGRDASIVEHYTLLPEAPDSDKAHAYWRKNIDILHAAIKEDFAMGEAIQHNLGSGANKVFRFGRYEQSLAWFHDNVQNALREHGQAVARTG